MYELRDPGPLVAPALVVAFDGWVSAGGAGTGAAHHVAADGPVIATFDSDALFDYRAIRPTIDFVEGVMEAVEYPSIALRHNALDGRDVLVLSGTEPNWRWKALGGAIADLSLSLGVVDYVSLGGIPWAAPHTRPTGIVMTSTDKALIEEDIAIPEGLLRVPASATSVIERYVADGGIQTVGLWARVPHYVTAPYYPALLSLVERLARHLGIAIPLGSLVDDSAEQRRQLDSLVEEQPQAKALVERLEALVDAEEESKNVSGEDLAAEIEKFLQQADDQDD